MLLDESGLLLTPATIAVNLDYTRNWVSRRLGRLLDAGLVERTDSAHYRITELGQDYIAGEVEADLLEE